MDEVDISIDSEARSVKKYLDKNFERIEKKLLSKVSSFLTNLDKSLNKKLSEPVKNINSACIRIEKLEESFYSITKMLGNLDKFFNKKLSEPINEMKDFCSRIEDLEESFSIIFHNIKRNQFLYSKYPEEWWETNYINFKESLKLQNEDYLNFSGVN
jgi:hypothetical protein